MKASFDGIAAEFGDRVAITDETGEATYAELAKNAAAIHETLLAPGTIVLVALPGGVAFTTTQLACFAAEAVFVPIPHQSTQREAGIYAEIAGPDVIVVASLAEQRAVVDAVDPRAIILTYEADPKPLEGRTVVSIGEVDARARSLLRTTASPFPKETRTIQFTSGSTGRPKGILLSNDSWRGTLEQNAKHLGAFRGKHVFCPLPQFHAMGNAVVVEHLWNGSPMHIANEFAPSTHVARLQAHRCAAILASPNYFKLMSRLGVLSAKALPSLSSVTIGTAAIDEVLIKDLRELFPEMRIHCRYGLSESVGCMVRLTLEAGELLPQKGLIGHPVPGVEVAPGLPLAGEGEPGEAGELRVKSSANAIGVVTEKGTWQPLLDDGGFLSTGDLAYRTADDKLLVRGRLSTFLKSNGYRINPFEIEDVLRAIPDVQEAVVVGVPDPAAGQRIIACLEPSPGKTLPDAPELSKICERQLSSYKVPQGFVVLSPLPRTQAGKPDRTRILEAATEWVENAAAAAAAAAKEGAGGDNTSRVSAIVARILSENVGHALSPKVDDDLVAAGYLDSLTMVSLVVALQEEFGIQIPVVSLTPERFASIALIVEFLFPKDGQVFETPDAGHYTPSATPTLNFAFTLALAVLLVALFAVAPSDNQGPLTIRQWRQVKARCEGCATFVVAGSSQAAVNLSPAAMQPALPEATIFNLGLSTQPYSEVYLDRIEHSLAKAARRGVLLVMTPVSLIPRKNDDEAAELLDMVAPDSKSRTVLDSARYFFHARSICEFAFGACNQHLYVSLRADGWQTETMVGGPSPAEGAARMSDFMRRWGEILRYEPANLLGLSARIKKWRSGGVHVYALRAPVPAVMRAAELAVQNYDEGGMMGTLSGAGLTWLAVDDSRYETIDGWHMDSDNAVRFSEDVARQIASLEAQTSEAE